MHMSQNTIVISGANVVNVYKHSVLNVYIFSAVHTLRSLPTAI